MKNLKTRLKTSIKKKNFFTFLLIFVLVITLIKNTDFFKNSYFIVNKNYDLRLQNAYDFCEDTGSGYIFEIKNKFRLTKIPQIKNYGTTLNLNWIFQNYKEFDNKKLILLFNLKKDGSPKINYNKYKILDNYKNDCLFLEKR